MKKTTAGRVLARPRGDIRRGLVREIIDAHQGELARLEESERRLFLPVLQKAQAELAGDLQKWVSTAQDGELRWTAHRYRTALLQIKSSALTLEQELSQRLSVATIRAQRMALNHLVIEVARFSHKFEGSTRVVHFDIARQVLTGRSYIVPHTSKTAKRYGKAVLADMKERLAIDILKGSTVRETTKKLIEHGGPKGLIDTGFGIQHIPEGLFRRYDFFAERIVRTEMCSAYNYQKLEGIEDLAKTEPELRKQWIADGAACKDICLPAAGQVVSVKQTFTTGWGTVEAPPAHPNCRCVCVPWMPGWD